jgi:hypothetical protein
LGTSCQIALYGYCNCKNLFAAMIDKVLKGESTAARIPNVTWEDVGGLGSIKSELINSIQLPLRFPKLFTTGIKRSGYQHLGISFSFLLAGEVINQSALLMIVSVTASNKGGSYVASFESSFHSEIRNIF